MGLNTPGRVNFCEKLNFSDCYTIAKVTAWSVQTSSVNPIMQVARRRLYVVDKKLRLRIDVLYLFSLLRHYIAN